eukprot:jgi/Undpi1/13774/HiC_scaffold_9.g03425.m1
MDCGQPETSWGGPTYGILLCVKCAGRHRSLGTHLTVIKSLTMDRWDAGQVKRMELGGNGQIQAWFEKCQTENSALEMKYRTKAATLYRYICFHVVRRGELREGGEEAVRSRSGSRGRARASSKGRIFAAAEKAAATDLARERAEAEAAAKKRKGKGSRRRRDAEGGGRSADTSAPHQPSSSSAYAAPAPAQAVPTENLGEQARRCGTGEEYEVVFGPGGMGFTLMKDAVSRALVTRLAPGGTAFRLGVRTGDYLVGVDGRRLHDYDQLMLLLPYAPRPLRLLFEGAGAALAAAPLPPSPPSRASSETLTASADGRRGGAVVADTARRAGGATRGGGRGGGGYGGGEAGGNAVLKGREPRKRLAVNGSSVSASAVVVGAAAAADVADVSAVADLAATEEVAAEAVVTAESVDKAASVAGAATGGDGYGREQGAAILVSASPSPPPLPEQQLPLGAGVGGGGEALAVAENGKLHSGEVSNGRKSKKGSKRERKGERDGDAGGQGGNGKGEGTGDGGGASPSRQRESVKVSVVDKKGRNWRKGLLRRRHGDGSWTVRYSGGLEERHVSAQRMRLRGVEDAAAAAQAAAATAQAAEAAAAAKAAAAATRQVRGGPAPGVGVTAAKEEIARRKSRKGRKDQGAAPPADEGKKERRRLRGDGGGGGGDGGGSGNDRRKEGGGALTWASADGTKSRPEEFRAPGELRDDFFSEAAADGDSDSDVPALAAYSRMDPATASHSAAFPPAAAAVVPPAYASSASAGGYGVPRRMEGFGGGGGGAGGSRARAGAGPSLVSSDQQKVAPPRESIVVFPPGSMGLTLTKEMSGGCSVTKVVPGGVAQARGVSVGQRVCAVNGQPSGTYEQTMAVIAGSPRPVAITFLDRPLPSAAAGKFGGIGGGGGPPVAQASWADVGLTATINAMDAANAVAVEWGLGANTPGILDEVESAVSIPPPPQGFRVHQKHSLMAIPTGVAGGYGNSLARHRTFAVDVPPDMAAMSTKKTLSDAPGEEEGEFDVNFGEGELGMRLEERGSFKASSVVVKITEDGQAMSLGIREGCTVVGINGEEYLSHAHTVATLKHAKRPAVVAAAAVAASAISGLVFSACSEQRP